MVPTTQDTPRTLKENTPPRFPRKWNKKMPTLVTPGYINVSTSPTTQVQFYQGWTTNTATLTTSLVTGSNTYFISDGNMQEIVKVEAPVLLLKGRTYDMPDGSKVTIDEHGGFQVDDTNAKVLYKAARVREFNAFLNASDLLEEYISELVPLGVKQNKVLHLEIQHFMCWLVHKAAERDRDPVPADIPKLPSPTITNRLRYHRCASCGRFLSRVYAEARITFCSTAHMEKKLVQVKNDGIIPALYEASRNHQRKLSLHAVQGMGLEQQKTTNPMGNAQPINS